MRMPWSRCSEVSDKSSVSVHALTSLNRYQIMMSCWSLASRDRPRFRCLVGKFNALLEREANYLELCQSLCWKEQETASAAAEDEVQEQETASAAEDEVREQETASPVEDGVQEQETASPVEDGVQEQETASAAEDEVQEQETASPVEDEAEDEL